jgi:phosphate/sulfate permease
MGFALIWGGASAVQWATPDPASFPPFKGVVPIILSWFFSPVLTGIAAALIFFVLRTLVLRRKNAYNMSFWVLPPAVLVTTFINIFFVCKFPGRERSRDLRKVHGVGGARPLAYKNRVAIKDSLAAALTY